MSDLARTRLVYIAPAACRSGVGDYADDFLGAVAPLFGDVVDYRIETEGAETARDVLAHVRRVRSIVAESTASGPTIVHIEQSGGSLSVFWVSVFLRGVDVTSTIHDPPYQVWWPFKTRFIGQHRLLHHAVHYPFRFAHRALQRRVVSDRHVFALTSVGAENIALRAPRAHPVASRIFVPERPTASPLENRPLAVGLFGHVYRGKGFDLIGKLRSEIDDDISIVAAGRGTAALPPVDGVTVLGEVNGTDEDDFFDSIRLLLVPYSKHSQYGKAFPASSAVTRSFAYGTPIVCLFDGALGETVAEGGAHGVHGVDEISVAVNTLVRDDDALRKLEEQVHRLQRDHDLDHCVRPFVDVWTQLASGR